MHAPVHLQPITIAYVDTHEPTHLRRARLWRTKLFVCRCERCGVLAGDFLGDFLGRMCVLMRMVRRDACEHVACAWSLGPGRAIDSRPPS